jgi:hypothetical protein
MENNENSIIFFSKGGEKETITLQLSDIIQIFDKTNDVLNENIFLIDYISPTFIRLIGKEKIVEFDIHNGIIGDGTITEIVILSRADSPSYAIQHNLTTGTWINIYFSGDLPIILTGLITNVEKDAIEIKTVDNDILYLNFNYYGIPLDLHIDEISIREKPYSLLKETQDEEKEYQKEEDEDEEGEEDEDKEGEEENMGMIEEYDKLSDIDIDLDLIDYENDVNIEDKKKEKNKSLFNIKNILLKANQITFGKRLNPIQQTFDVNKEDYVYSLEEQLNDLLNII